MTKLFSLINLKFLVIALSITSILSIIYFFESGTLIAYGDAESHLNIAKRVIHSLTPGFAQLGGIWLPLPHLLLAPFVFFDPLWRTGLAGSIVAGFLFVVSGVYIYKISLLLTNKKVVGLVAVFIFSTNPNILYLQSTAMTEIPLIAFFMLSTYYFLHFIKYNNLISLVLAAFWGLCASLSRYDGWFLVLAETSLLFFYYFLKIIQKAWSEENIKPAWYKMESRIILYSTLALVGIFSWIMWDYLILGDPFYFTNSPFSAKSQQQGWAARGELPTHNNVFLSFLYYAYTTYLNVGSLLTLIGLLGLVTMLVDNQIKTRLYASCLLLVPFLFYVVTLNLGQSVIFAPGLTPENYEWKLFNVRYGVMMIPAIAIFVGYLFNKTAKYKLTKVFAILIVFSVITQPFIFLTSRENAITIDDGLYGLSSAKETDVQGWLLTNYDHGLVLIDDYARTVSIIKSGIPMQNVIYIGTKPYWEESLRSPELHARWIIMQNGDVIWNEFLGKPEREGHLYKYYQRTYTSPEILVFKRIEA